MHAVAQVSPLPPTPRTDIVLPDGSSLLVRTVCPGDQSALSDFLGTLSPEAIRSRFCGATHLERMAAAMAAVDLGTDYALVAHTATSPALLAHATFLRLDERRAEAAFVVGDGWQGRGIATILLGQLAEVAAARGIRTFLATMLPQNHRMLRVFCRSGFPAEISSSHEEIEVRMSCTRFGSVPALAA